MHTQYPNVSCWSRLEFHFSMSHFFYSTISSTHIGFRDIQTRCISRAQHTHIACTQCISCDVSYYRVGNLHHLIHDSINIIIFNIYWTFNANIIKWHSNSIDCSRCLAGWLSSIRWGARTALRIYKRTCNVRIVSCKTYFFHHFPKCSIE